jgi:hypothetical protein
MTTAQHLVTAIVRGFHQRPPINDLANVIVAVGGIAGHILLIADE